MPLRGQKPGAVSTEVRPWTGTRNLKFKTIANYLSAFDMPRGDADYRHDVEAFVLRILVNNTFNKNIGTFKRKN